ncbi:hypothetical protein CCACVL1_20380 [Corchorus capsularis]|uniref:Uncharacterized protein n=1 Tax=Corchorus capsularis TaxID=210143 RepID=A0A1R3HBI3_COCAP|nr:hypothetical protein CCACVL1_20380 [Corchorus capsularis]
MMMISRMFGDGEINGDDADGDHDEHTQNES